MPWWCDVGPLRGVGRPRVFLAGYREPWPAGPDAAAPLGRMGFRERWYLSEVLEMCLHMPLL